MTVLVASVLMTVTIIASGLAAGPLVQNAAPALMRRPRLAVAGLLTTLGIWLLGLAAIGPMLAWGLSGPSDMMPGNTAMMCQRCLAAANPLPAGMEINIGIPMVFLVAMPLLLATVLAVSGYQYWRKHRAERAKLEHVLNMGARSGHVAGVDVTIVPWSKPSAFAMSKRRWGIVVSTGLLQTLTTDEMSAVVAHEAAHLHQRHHLVLGILHGLIRPLRWIPFVATIEAAIPHYLEMAADNAGRAATSTPVLASALLKIGEKSGQAARPACGSVALHAAGTDRIRHLVAPPAGVQGIAPVSGMLGIAAVLLTTSVLVQLPYFKAVLDGCLL